MDKAYEFFKQRSRELTDLTSTLSSLMWDLETMIPPRGIPFRAVQISTLSALHHQRLTSPDLAETLDQLGEADLDLWSRSSLRELSRQHERAMCIPEELVRELAETKALAYGVWVEARKESNFAKLSPWLEKVFDLKRQEARCIKRSDCLYESLLDEYEPGMTVTELDELFGSVRPQLTTLMERIQTSSRQPEPDVLRGTFPLLEQETFGRCVLTSMGFDWKAGRLDRSPHPFCTGLSPFDVRITTRYAEEDFSSSLFGTIHEGGHALYEQGLNSEFYGLPACDGISLGIHESQSRLWENQVARSRPFWEYWFPQLKRSFPGLLDQVPLDTFVQAINRVQPSYIRVEADEVTYGLHVILRYELEKLLIDEHLQVADLEEVWNSKMNEYFGITPSCSAEGVLQDTHWSQGLIGYFPTYLLGSLYAAQIFYQAKKVIPDFEEDLCQGRLLPLREWLQKEIHQHGKTVTADELIRKISGEGLKSRYMLHYLEEKFGELYALDLVSSHPPNCT